MTQPHDEPTGEPAAFEQPMPPAIAGSEVGEAPARSAVIGRPTERLDELPPHMAVTRQIEEYRARLAEIRLRSVVGWTLLAALVFQILVADTVFIIYAVINRWQVEGGTMQVWLAATVVQVIGLVWVVVRYLFSTDAAPR